MSEFSISSLDPNLFVELNSSKLEDTKNSGKDLKEVANQFEALFLSQMLKSARAAKLADDIFSNNATDTYYSMLDNKLAEELSKNGDFGIAEALIKQFSNNQKGKSE